MSAATRERPAAKASRTESAQSAPPAKFQTSMEEMNVPGTPLDKKHESALMLNPNASLTVVVAAARARIQTLVCSIHAWQCVHDDVDCVSISEVLGLMAPFAEEVEMLLDAVAGKLAEGRRHG